MGITLSDIQQAVSRYYLKEFLGTYNVESSTGGKEWIRLALMPETKDEGFDASRIRVKSAEGKLISLDELVTVSHMEEAPQSYYRINGLNSIYLSITAEETANQLQLSKQVKEEMEAIQKVLPAGYEIHTSYDATEFIHEELNKIYLRTGLTVLSCCSLC